MTELQLLLASNSVVLLTLTTVLGLLVGSFLNVVAYRLPIMMERRWKQECTELQTGEPAEAQETFNLVKPASTCPSCGHKIRPWENIPVLSYLLQKGRCVSCNTSISAQYPFVELATGILSLLVVWHFGYSSAALAALVFTWILVALTTIDFNTQLLPDNLTYPLLWLGLLLNLDGMFTDYASSLLGAVFGYLSLWSVFIIFKLVTGKEGMGHGDFKLLAALGAWVGWQFLPLIIVLSSVVGAIVGVILIRFRNHEHGTPMPFGPFLATAGWIALMWGEPIIEAYLRATGL